jgi:hypothetical protein
MEGREKPHTYKYKIMNDWNYDTSYMFMLLPVSELQHFKHWFPLHRAHKQWTKNPLLGSVKYCRKLHMKKPSERKIIPISSTAGS